MTHFIKSLCAAAGAGFILLPAGARANAPSTGSAGTSSIAQAIPRANAGQLLDNSLTFEGNRLALESHATLYTGYYGASSGYSDRFVTGAFVDIYPGATGIHADILYVDREQNAGFASLGISHEIAGIGRLKVMAGTSTGNQNVLPDLSLQAVLEVQPAQGLILRPAVSYRHFRHGASQIAPSVQIAHYFGGGSGGYFVAQADAGLTFTNTGRTGWSIAAGLTNVRSNGLRMGLAVRTGYMSYDSLVGTEVRSRLYGGGPNIGYRFLSGHELFVRSDVTRNKYYTVTGAIVGFKVPL
jgi:hypothetical protein